MHDEFKQDDLRRLMQKNTEHSVSLYMPANRISTEMQKDMIRLKNLISQAQDELQARGMRRPDAAALLKPASDLLEDTDFWQHQSAGLAIFVAQGMEAEIYRLPIRFNVHYQVADRFYLKPLIRLFSLDDHYFVLALSQQDVRFFRGDRDGLERQEVADMPHSIEEALGEWEPNRQLQFHTGTGGSSGGRQDAMFFGHAGNEPQMKEELERFFRHIDAALHNVLREEKAPLVLAGVEYLHPIYAEVSDYAHIVEKGHAGNVEETALDDLHAATWKIVEPIFREQLEADRATFAQLAGTGRTGHYVDEVATAAFQGRVETAFLPSGRRVWGQFDPSVGKVVAQDEPVDLREGASRDRTTPNGAEAEGKEDLLDFIAMHTFLNGGAVHITDRENVPGQGDAAAIYRF